MQIAEGGRPTNRRNADKIRLAALMPDPLQEGSNTMGINWSGATFGLGSLKVVTPFAGSGIVFMELSPLCRQKIKLRRNHWRSIKINQWIT